MSMLSKTEIKSITESLNSGITPAGVFVAEDGYFDLGQCTVSANNAEIVKDEGREYFVDRDIWRKK